MKYRFCTRDLRDETAHCFAITADSKFFIADQLVCIDSVGFPEGLLNQGCGDLEADVVEIGGWWEAAFAELVHIEGELDADVLVFALGIVD